jgi:tRNA G37 N-methylase Trm5
MRTHRITETLIVTLGYPNRGAQKLLPEGMDIPCSFETVGHVAHINLRDSALPYKRLIGRVLLDKNGPRIRSIVNKVCVRESERARASPRIRSIVNKVCVRESERARAYAPSSTRCV